MQCMYYISNQYVYCMFSSLHSAMRISTFKSRYLFIRYEIKCHMRHGPWEVVGGALYTHSVEIGSMGSADVTQD